MKIFRIVLLAAVAGLCYAATALAADIEITVDSASKTMTLTSLLGTQVHVMGLVSPNGYHGTSVELPAQGSATVPLVGNLPLGIDSARCSGGPEGIPGLTPTAEGFYLVSAEVR